jgi:hypothetical protein
MNDNDGLDARLQQLYHQLPKQQPSATVDAQILAAAKLKTHWHQPFALAATLVLTTSLIWYWQAEQPQQLEQAMSSAPMAKSIEPSVAETDTLKKDVKPEAKKAIAQSQPNISDMAENKVEASEVKAKRESAPTLNEQVAQLADIPAPPAPSPTVLMPEPIAEQKDAPIVELQAAASERSVLAKQNAKSEGMLDIAKKNKLQVRTQEDVKRVFQQQWPRLDNIYQKALKDTPAMQGKLQLKLTIDASGKVTHCELVFSELNNMEFEAHIVDMVKMFDFGEAENIWQGIYLVDFIEN